MSTESIPVNTKQPGGYEHCLGVWVVGEDTAIERGSVAITAEVSCIVHNANYGHGVVIDAPTEGNVTDPANYPLITRALGCATCVFGQAKPPTTVI